MDIDASQFGLMSGRRKADAILIAKQFQEKYLGKGKKLHCISGPDLEKPFEQVP